MEDENKAPSQTKYPLKVQAIRSGKQYPRLYVYFPLPLAAAIGSMPVTRLLGSSLTGANSTWCATKVRAASAQAGQPVAPSLNHRHDRLFVASPQDALCKLLGPRFLARSAPLFPNS